MMTPTRVIALLLSISCAFLLGREFSRRAVIREMPGPAYDLQTVAATRAGAALSHTAAITQAPTFVDVADRLRPSVVSIYGRSETILSSSGTGLIVSAEGAVLTNNHVVEGLTEIWVTLSSSDRYPATIVGQDEPTDLALLKLEGVTGLFPASFGDSDALRVAEDVLVIGNPFLLGWTVTRGIISSVHRSELVGDPNDPRVRGRRSGPAPYTDYIQTDAAINLGNSGGPLVNAKGEVVGISVSILAQSERTSFSTGIGFAIPSNDARFVANELMKNGRVRRGYLGFVGKDLTGIEFSNEARRRLSPTAGNGAYVTEVQKDTPAERSGLQVGDVIISMNGKAVESFQVLRNRVARTPPLTEVAMKVIRDGHDQDVRAVIGEYPSSPRDDEPR